MKTYKLIILLILFPFLFISCPGDTDTAGKITIDGTTYELSHGYIEYGDKYRSKQSDKDFYSANIILTSSGLTLETADTVYGGIRDQGVGHLISIVIFSDTTDRIIAGTYAYDIDKESVPDTFRGTCVLEYDPTEEESKEWYKEWYVIKSGITIITIEGGIYEITVNAVADQIDKISNGNILREDIDISSYYEGTLDEL